MFNYLLKVFFTSLWPPRRTEIHRLQLLYYNLFCAHPVNKQNVSVSHARRKRTASENPGRAETFSTHDVHILPLADLRGREHDMARRILASLITDEKKKICQIRDFTAHRTPTFKHSTFREREK